MTDWNEIRARFPAVDRCAYLNTAAGGPISLASAAAGAGYYEATARDGDVHWDEWLERVEETRGRLARFVGARPHEIAFNGNASLGVNLVAGMLRDRRRVLAVQGDFPSVTLPWLQSGYDVRFVAAEPDGGACRDAIADELAAGAEVLVLGLVQYRTGYRYDLRALGRLCRAAGAALVVDVTQSLGALELDLSAGDVDFVVGSGYKWLTSGYGIGFLYVNERWLEPDRFSAVGWRSAREPYALVAERLDLAPAAHALEMGNPPFPGVFTLGAALDLFEQVGGARVQERVLELSGSLRRRLVAEGLEVLSSAAPEHSSGIVFARVADPAATEQQLGRSDVLVSVRGDGIRVSTHLYNNEDDLDRLVRALRGAGSGPGAR